MAQTDAIIKSRINLRIVGVINQTIYNSNVNASIKVYSIHTIHTKTILISWL